ncbi:phytoene/squalene synthase family protein [Candidatus Woesearchaeota archaeon]|nr:phytoene/squalene synthase family protein [Candidatus Woesearchaeota archaeon]
MVTNKEEKIFQRGSKTYYAASKFFPQPYRDDVFTLYAYARTADDFVDTIPSQKKDFLVFKKETLKALRTGKSEQPIIQNFVLLTQRKQFSVENIRSFLSAMEHDISPKPFRTFADVDKYIHGSAEVIGLFMARIFNLPKKLNKEAQLLGKAMQYINWLRDISEDNKLGRQYIPQEVLDKHFLKNLSYEEARAKPAFFKNLMYEELTRYMVWQTKAAYVFKDLPRCMYVPVKTASDAYAWTANQLRKDPFIVYKKKVKPSKQLLLWFALRNKVKAWTSKRC